jgi:hypothetical protein
VVISHILATNDPGSSINIFCWQLKILHVSIETAVETYKQDQSIMTTHLTEDKSWSLAILHSISTAKKIQGSSKISQHNSNGLGLARTTSTNASMRDTSGYDHTSTAMWTSGPPVLALPLYSLSLLVQISNSISNSFQCKVITQREKECARRTNLWQSGRGQTPMSIGQHSLLHWFERPQCDLPGCW